MTLTTEQLKEELIERIAISSGLRTRDGRNAVAEAIYAEVVQPLLVANREAQPVAVVPEDVRDALRYRFLKDKDAWGCDNEPSLVEWDDLIDLEGSEFDAAIDARIANSDVDYAAPPAPVLPTTVNFSENSDADMCRAWAWERVKEMVTTDSWDAGDSTNFFAFFCWGWDMRRQYNEQRPPEPAASKAAYNAVRAQERADLLVAFEQHINVTGLADGDLVTVIECLNALKHVAEQRDGK